MNVIIAGEESGVIRNAFAARGHNAWSCDLKPTRSAGQHIQGSWHDLDWSGWDLLIAHPECTHIAVSGALHFLEKRADGRQQEAIEEFMFLASAPVAKKVIENPIGIMSTLYRKPDQIIQPHQFGEDASKATCLWLTELPALVPTRHVAPRIVNGRPRWANQTGSGQNKLGPSEHRVRDRSATYHGIADAMASQWGAYL